MQIDMYHAAMVTIRHWRRIMAFYAARKVRGKTSHVTIIAIARKILVLANAFVRNMKLYKDRTNSICLKTS